MKVLITGGAGYLGTELVGGLAAEDAVSELTIFDNLSRRNHNLFLGHSVPDKPIRFVQGDILDTRTLGKLVAESDVVVHLAARVSTPFADADFHGLDQVNHWGTAELAYLLREHPGKRLLYVSSASVYGASESPLDHDSLPRPKTAYGVSKWRGEQALAAAGPETECIVMRCANVYGYSRSMRFEAVINRYLFDAQFNRRLTVHGSGEQHRAFVHVKNAVRVFTAAVMGQIPEGTYHLVERNMTILEVAQAVGEVYPDLELLFIEQDMRLRNLLLGPDPRLEAMDLFQPGDFAAQLREFAARFSFAPPA